MNPNQNTANIAPVNSIAQKETSNHTNKPKIPMIISVLVGIFFVGIAVFSVLTITKKTPIIPQPNPIEPPFENPDIQVGGTEKYIDITSCDQTSQLVINEKNLPPENIHSCKTENQTVKNTTFSLVDIAYGPAMDCPSGCIYNFYKGVVLSDGKTIYDLPSSGPDGILSQVWAQPPLNTARNYDGFDCPSDLTNYITVTLDQLGQNWGWKLDFTSPLTCKWQEFNAATQNIISKTITLNGSMFVYLDNEQEMWNRDGLNVKETN